MIDLLQHVGSVRSVGARLLVAAKSVACAAVVLLATQFSFAADRLTLKDGQVLEGTVTRELDGVIWFKYKLAGVEQVKMFTSTEFTKLERDAGAATDTKGETPASDKAATPAVPSSADTKPTTAKRSGVPRAAVVTLGETRDDKQGDMVGIYMTAYALQQMRPMLEEEVGNDGTGIVVLRINSGGGALLEIQKLSDEIHKVYKEKFRTVGWIDSAISAAAMTGIALEEIYFTHRGNFGACTGYRGRLDAMKGIELERVLIMMQQISARGGYDPLIMRAMQISVPLSATRGADGKMQFFPDETSGEFIVNRKGEILTLNPESARKIDFSRGTASTLDELTKAMGYQELDWVGEDVPGSLYPISKAEKWNIAYRVKAKTDEDRTQEYFTNYTLNVNAAASEQTREGRGRFVGRARVALDKIREMVRNNPNFMIFALNIEDEAEYKEWLAREEKRLRDLMR
jgi:hypothetical protein